ncbi:MAG: hypothetical protein HYZ79_04020 [Candidatus Melainabacteria bacterium]|nr:hypothetical protein [Candidatus Melainabacteria bacterium]
MKNNSKMWLILKLIIINIVISLCILLIALWTSFPYLKVVPQEALDEKNAMRIIEGGNIHPAFKYDRYDIELGEKTEIELILKPETNVIRAEVVSAESIGLGIDTAKLLKKGLKIIKPRRPRNKLSKREEILEERIFRTKLTYHLNQIENKFYQVKKKDYKVFKILVKGVLPGSYTLKSSTTDGQSATATILTKPEFRIDSISPSILDVGVDGVLTVEGKNLDAFTQISIGNGIEIKDIQALDDGKLKVYVHLASDISYGFKDVTATNLHTGSSAILVNGFYVGPRIGKDGEPGKEGAQGQQGPQGEPGLEGPAGVSGMSICDHIADTLMIFVNNIPSNNEASSFFDPILCNLTLGIPVGASGSISHGGAGEAGPGGLNSLIKVTDEPDGDNCKKGGIKVESGLDSNRNGVLDISEVASTNYVCGSK